MVTSRNSWLKYSSMLFLLIAILLSSGCDKDDDTIPSFTDMRDGQTYAIVTIGTQTWMAENLNYNPPGGGAKCYDNDADNCNIYGRLYDWETAVNIAPDGWHVPSREEWNTLIDFLGGVSVAGGKLKESGLDHWASPNGGATNESGFTALPAGQIRENDGMSADLGISAHFWTATLSTSTVAWSIKIGSLFPNVYQPGVFKAHGYSVRCIKD